MKKYTVLFQGDSITDSDRNRQISPIEACSYGTGYVNMIAARLQFQNHNASFLNTAIGGDRIGDTYARWIEDTLRLDYDILSILTGINDVGFQFRLNKGSDNERFKFIYDRMLYEAKEQNPDCLVVIGQPFVFKVKSYDGNTKRFDIYEDFEKWNNRIIELGEISREMCQKYNGVFVPYRENFNVLLNTSKPEFWTKDGIHPKCVGSEAMARLWIEKVGEKFELY